MSATVQDVTNSTLREALLSVASQNQGVLNPRLVVDAARKARSPLHPYFEWDDAVAGEQYRLAQAHALIRRVRLTITRQVDESREVALTTTRAFQSRPSQRSALGGYESVDDILNDEEKRAELIAQVSSELRAYRRRYGELAELARVWDAIDELGDTESPTELPAAAPPSV